MPTPDRYREDKFTDAEMYDDRDIPSLSDLTDPPDYNPEEDDTCEYVEDHPQLIPGSMVYILTPDGLHPADVAEAL